jgi:hypothetical protein
MCASRLGSSNVRTELRAWEPPALVELKIGSETKSNRDRGRAPQPAGPPAAPVTKLGFSFELAFPLSSRIEK